MRISDWSSDVCSSDLTVSDTAYLVSPGIFQRYAQEHPQVGTLAKQESQQDWQWVQKRFERLPHHRKHPNGIIIWTCEVTGPRTFRRLHGTSEERLEGQEFVSTFTSLCSPYT